MELSDSLLEDELLGLLDDELLELLLEDELLLELLDDGCGGSHAESIAKHELVASISQTTNLTPFPAAGVTICGPKTWLPLLTC